MRARRRSVVCGLIAAATLSFLVPPAQAQAQSGSPFACLTPTVFVAQDVNTQLSALTYGTGASTFTPIGGRAGFAYNAIGFDPTDGFIYGIRSDGALLRIDDSGAAHVVGPTEAGGSNIGAVDDDGRYYVTASGRTSLLTIDTATGATVREQPLSGPPLTADLTVIDGMLWGKETNSPNLVRVDPATGQVTRFAQSAVPAAVAAGAAWTYGNGNLGLSDNTTGRIYQVAIAGGGTASPSFDVVAESDGPASGNNDGTSCPGQPADLAISKTTTSPAFVGQSVTWTLTVRNNGPGISSGYTVTDDVPAGFTDVASSTPGCSVAGNRVTCGHGPQQPGEEAQFTITATASTASAGENSATVVGNERDPEPGNDTVTVPANVVELVGLCRGTPIAALGLLPLTANPAETPCRTEERALVRIYQGNVLRTLSVVGTEVWGRTASTPLSATGRADIATLDVSAPGLSLQATGVHSEAHSVVGTSCTDITTSSRSSIATLVVNGQTHVVGDEPRTIPIGLGTVHVNQELTQGTTVTRRAIHVDLPGTALDVTVAESRAGMACGSLT